MAGAVTPICYGRHKFFDKEPLAIQAAASSAGEQQTAIASGADATVVITPPTPAKSGNSYGVALDRIDFSYRTTPTPPAFIQASDQTNTWGPFYVTAQQPFTFVFDPPLLFKAGAAVTVTLKDGSAIKDLFVHGHIVGIDTA